MTSATDTPAKPGLRARLRERLAPQRARLLRAPSTIRARTIVAFVGLLALATFASVLVTRGVLLIRLDQRVDSELTQEANELRRLARGNDPATGRPFRGNADRIFDTFLRRNIPAPYEAIVTFVDGEPYLRSRPVTDYRLDLQPEIVERWATLREADRDAFQTPDGRVEYLAVPLTFGGEPRGVFVSAIFRDRAKSEVDEATRAAAAVGLAVLLLGSLLAWRFADRIVGPVGELTRTSRAISETDFSRRIPVEGQDEVAQLATTYNDMLDRLENAFSSQRRFLDDVGHELKTPLTIVRGHLELLGDDPEERRETMTLVVEELDRMARIVEDLLLLAKREQPGFLTLETVDVGELTDALLAKAAALGPAEWTVESRGRGVIVADGQRLTQAILQLAQNAVRHAGGTIALGSQVADGEARFWVRDRGPGIDPEEQTAIFTRFGRGDQGPGREGAGLGLPIVRAIAEAHHGRVEVASLPGIGSTFAIVVPVDQPHVEGP
jgi:signal transduction histidine kinase